MGFAFTIIDVFTDVALAGNQLAVFADGAAVPDELLQPIAKEIGFSETVFVYPDDRIRIFTPALELPFAGHPVLGTARVLADGRGAEVITLVTGKGPVDVTFDHARRGRMTQPLPTVVAMLDIDDLLAALGCSDPVVPAACYDNGPRHVDIVLASIGELERLHPDMGALAQVAGATGVSVIAGAGTRWRTRYFIPGADVDEDPATGSAAGPIAVHLARHGLTEWGAELTLEQGAEIGRPSTLYARAEGGADAPTRVEVAGDAVVVGRGELDL